MTSESITIILPLPPKVLSPNYPTATWGGRFKRVAATRRQRRLAREAVEACCVETAPWEKVEVTAFFYFKTDARRDPDNANGSLKAAYDGIVDAGLVVDDDWKHMKRMPPVCIIDPLSLRVVLDIVRCNK